MGKHFWMKHLDDESHDKKPGCMWGLVHVLDYHHWQSNVRKMIQHRKYEDRTHDKCNWSPETNMCRHDYEAQKLFDEKESPYLSTKRSRATKKRSLKARIKALIAEEISRESDDIRGEGLSFKSNLQRTYSIHHLESLDDGFGKICKDWKHPIIFLPRNVDDCATQSVDTTQMKAAGNQEASRGKGNMGSPKGAAKPDSEEDPDVLEIFKVDKALLIKHLQDADENFVNFSRSALGLNTKAKFSKSRSFPMAELSQRRKLKPIKLENKQKEVWSFPREDNFQTVNQAPRMDRSGYFNTGLGELAGDVSNGGHNIMIKRGKQRNNEVIMLSDIGSDTVKSGRTSLAVELNKLPSKSPPSESFEEVADRKAHNTMDRIGEKPDENDIRKHTHRRSSSLNESLDKYAWLFENSFQTNGKLNPSKSLKLTNEYSHAPVYFRRIHSLSIVDSYYSNPNLEVLGDDPSENGSVVTAKDSSSGLRKSEEEKEVSLLTSDGENVPLNANMLIKEDDASLRSNTSDGDCEKLKKSDSLWEQDTNCSDIAHKELPDRGFILDSDICLQETESDEVELQISEGMEHGSSIHELNFSIDTNDLENLHSKSLSTSTLNLENDEVSDKTIKCFARDACPKKSNSDLFYVRHLLDQSAIAIDASEITWHASDQPFSPQLFEEVEACWPHEQDQLNGCPDFCGCWHHQMLFDLVNEVLLEVYDISLPYYPKALSSSCHVRPFPVGNHIIEEVCTSIGTLLNLKPEEKQSLDCIVARDLTHDHSWMNLQIETECVALDLEDMIFNELLEEVIIS
ncbi:hypothetical protein Pfo_007070 [Paulownia fortunei]|nr:hypothetical protein Pfo_007070 [Paulownia fortunei]